MPEILRNASRVDHVLAIMVTYRQTVQFLSLPMRLNLTKCFNVQGDLHRAIRGLLQGIC